MARKKIAANVSVFSLLDYHCRRSGDPIATEGARRWISSTPEDAQFLVRSVFDEVAVLSPRRRLARVTMDALTFVVSVGLEHEEVLAGLDELEVKGGHLAAILSELGVQPVAPTARIRDIVEFDDLDQNENYEGHDASYIAQLFPPIRLFADPQGHLPWNLYFRLCLMECRSTIHWGDEELFSVLDIVADLDADRIPYRVLCRSIFDVDPSSFYLALYRCLEALFAYTSAKELKDALKLPHRWDEIAASLEDTLGWYPHEDRSLERLLDLAMVGDLRQIANQIEPSSPVELAPAGPAAKRIYRLRNAIVHFRPAQHAFDLGSYEWQKICRSLAVIILDVYNEVFTLGPMATTGDEKAGQR